MLRHPRPSFRPVRRPRLARHSPWLLLVLLALAYWAVRSPQQDESPRPTPAGEGWSVVARVIDGDTVDLNDSRRVRLIGVDTPEMGYSPRARVEGTPDPLAEKATAFVRDAVEGRRVRLEHGPEATENYARRLAYIYLVDGRPLYAELLRRGYARAYRHFPHPLLDDFIALEEAARAARRGLWATGK